MLIHRRDVRLSCPKNGTLSIVIKGEKGGVSEEAVQYMAAPDSPGTTLHRENGEHRQNTQKHISNKGCENHSPPSARAGVHTV